MNSILMVWAIVGLCAVLMCWWQALFIGTSLVVAVGYLMFRVFRGGLRRCLAVPVLDGVSPA